MFSVATRRRCIATVHLICSYNYVLVALSVLIAMLTSYAALDLAGRVMAAGGWTRLVWLLGGAGVMGTGIWSMHYIGMLACVLPVSVAYHWPTVLLSLFAAILASVIALYVVTRQKMAASRAFAGSVLMGVGIASMHYIGMAAMRLPAISHYNSFIVVLSVVLAVLISLAALWITFYFRDEKAGTGWRKTAGAVVMGAAIPVMHYTGMAAVRFTPSGIPADLSDAASISTLGTAGIAVATLIVLGLAMLTSWVDRRFAAQALERQEEKLRTSEEKYRDLINASPDAVCVFDADRRYVLVNPAGVELSGRPERELIGSSVADTYLPEELHLFRDRFEQLKVEGSLRFEREFVRGNGEVIPVEVSLTALRGGYYQAIIRDISKRKRREALIAGENRILEMVAKGDSLVDILDDLCRLVEEQSSDVLASILLMDPNGKQLRHGAAPNLPKAYTEVIDGAFIGPSVGSCGTAAYLAEQVIVSDIATDPLWSDFRDLALGHSLRACWSTPIMSSEGTVIGTFAMYYREPRSPSLGEQETIKHITHLAGVAIQRKLAETARRESEAYLAEAQRLSHTGSWAWTPATGEIRYWSEETYRVLGFDPAAGPPRFEKFFGRLHPDDQDRVRDLFGKAIAQNADFETDYRIVHPSGAVKDIHAVGHPVCDQAGHLVEFVGTVIDITESKRSEAALRASEQVARGQVEALAQSLDVLATAPDPEKFIGQMLGTIGRLLKADTVTLWLFDDESDSLILRSSTAGDGKLTGPDPEHPFIKNPLFWKDNAVVQELLFTAGPVVCDNVTTDPRVTGEWAEYLKRDGTRRFLGVPLLVGGHVRGFVGIRHVDLAPYRPEDIELTQALAHQVMLALQLNEFAEQGQRAAIFEERNRMARDIHDTLAQGFTGVIVQLEAAEDAISCGSREDADAHLHRAGELARRSLSEARRSVHALRPQALQEYNFWQALKGIIKNTTVGTALHTTFEAQGKLPELPQPWQENLLHIGQEALTNTLKYAHARTFKTRLTYKAKELRLELRDDGDGFKVKDRHDGLGLTGMRERVEQMGGELEITSSRSKGTKITVLLPCNGELSS
jgi:PAS domain S-box-containing protein